jgi:hypothetical protein
VASKEQISCAFRNAAKPLLRLRKGVTTVRWPWSFSFALMSGVLASRAVFPAEHCKDDAQESKAIEARTACVEQTVTNTPEEQRALIVQKIMLLKAYLLSSSVQRARDSGHAEATALISEANALLKQAQVDVENDRIQKAGEALDSGLRLASLGASFAAKHQSSTEQEARKYGKLLNQIESYLTAVRSALVEINSNEQPVEAR